MRAPFAGTNPCSTADNYRCDVCWCTARAEIDLNLVYVCTDLVDTRSRDIPTSVYLDASVLAVFSTLGFSLRCLSTIVPKKLCTCHLIVHFSFSPHKSSFISKSTIPYIKDRTATSNYSLKNSNGGLITAGRIRTDLVTDFWIVNFLNLTVNALSKSTLILIPSPL